MPWFAWLILIEMVVSLLGVLYCGTSSRPARSGAEVGIACLEVAGIIVLGTHYVA